MLYTLTCGIGFIGDLPYLLFDGLLRGTMSISGVTCLAFLGASERPVYFGGTIFSVSSKTIFLRLVKFSQIKMFNLNLKKHINDVFMPICMYNLYSVTVQAIFQSLKNHKNKIFKNKVTSIKLSG